MSLITIDPDKCKRDGICVDVCPARLIALDDNGDPPHPIPNAEEYCITCGHCVAVCPHGALSHQSMSPDECLAVQKELKVTGGQVEQLLRARRSIRAYKDEPLDRETINGLIETARYAPSGHNIQPVNWIVIEDRAEVRRLAGIVVDWMRFLLEAGEPIATELNMDRIVDAWGDGLDRVCRNAPHLVLVHAPEEQQMAIAASTIALTYLELTAYAHGLGACWAGYINAAAGFWPAMQEAVALPEGHVCRGAMMLGRPKYRYPRIPKRNDPPITWR